MAGFANRWLEFDCNPERGTFQLHAAGNTGLEIDNARLRLRYRSNEKGFVSLEDSWGVFTPGAVGMQFDSPHGLLHVMQIFCGLDRNGIETVIDFALPENAPLLLWRLHVTNHSTSPVTMEEFCMLAPGSQIRTGLREQPQRAFFSNGWQSWNWSATYDSHQPSRRTRLSILEAPMYINPATPQPRVPGHYTADFFGVLADRGSRLGWLAGFLSQKQQFGAVEGWLTDQPDLRLWASGDGARVEVGGDMITDWAALQPVHLDDEDPMAPYMDAVARENTVRLQPGQGQPPAGWCSWYYYYQKLSAADIRKNTAAVQSLNPQLPLELVQIDDGFKSRVGDWFTFRRSFPDGVAPLAREISAAGLRPGLWLAPFIVDPRSQLAREHPEYLLRDSNGRTVGSGFNWNSFTTALDLSFPPALEYAVQVVKTAVNDWGFSYLKLDFLYAGGLRGRFHDPHLSSCAGIAACRGLEALRAAAGKDTFLLGCGVPLGSAVGLFEGMRIGADTAGTWAPNYLGISPFFQAEPHMPALRNALQNTLTRSVTHQRWWFNDPDCLFGRPG